MTASLGEKVAHTCSRVGTASCASEICGGDTACLGHHAFAASVSTAAFLAFVFAVPDVEISMHLLDTSLGEFGDLEVLGVRVDKEGRK